MNRALLTLVAIAFAVASTGPALAQDGDESLGQTPWPEVGEEAPEAEAAEPAPAAAGPAGATAVDAPRKWYFGLYARYVFVPAFVLELFLDEAPTVGNFAPGLAVNFYDGEGGPSFQLGIGYTSFAFEDPFRAKGDPELDTEWVKSDLGFVHLTGSVLWNVEIIAKKLSFEYGVGLDVGVVTGELLRSEAYRDAGGNWHPCLAPLTPDPNYCELPQDLAAGSDAYDQEGAHYGVVEESVPPLFVLPILPHLALRYEPITGLAFKFETSLFPLVWFGISAAYAPL